MEHSATRNALPALILLACLLLPLVSSVPLSRSVFLRNLRQGSASGLEASVQDLVVAKAVQEQSLDEVAARMVIEVNDYPGSGANNRHDPKSPGRP